jgi:hypothetical protein
MFTNLSWDMRYYSAVYPQIRTNVSPWDFGYARVGSRSLGFGQDWYYYYAVPATNGLGQPNTNWIQMSVDLAQALAGFPDLESSGLINTMFAQDDANFGNAVLSGTQFIWFDNITYIGWLPRALRPQMSIQQTIPALRMFGGNSAYGHSQIQISTNYLNDGWIGGTYPVTYSLTLLDNATSPGGLDTHIHSSRSIQTGIPRHMKAIHGQMTGRPLSCGSASSAAMQPMPIPINASWTSPGKPMLDSLVQTHPIQTRSGSMKAE